MKTKAQLFKALVKGSRIQNAYVVGALTLTALTRSGSSKMLTADGNADEIEMRWTSDGHLYAMIPLADKEETALICFERASGIDVLEGGMRAFMAQAKLFGDKDHLQKLGSVSYTVDGGYFLFCDIARAGSNSAPDDNEGKVANGPKLAVRFIHLVESKDLKGSSHVLVTSNEDQESIFGAAGDVTTVVWINGKVLDVNTLDISEEE